MLFKSLLLSQASGSIAGAVFSHNQGGMYVRARATPTNPNSDAQQAVRDAMREIVNAWSNTLSNAQRASWETYAFNTPTLNRLGEATHKTGQQMFIRGNIARMQAGFSFLPIAPTTFDVGTFSPLVPPTCDASASTISVPFTNTDEWANTDNGLMFVYQSRPQNATRNFGKGPYQLVGIVEGDGVTPPTSPAVMTSLFPMAVGQKVFFKINVAMGDGRYSAPQQPASIVVA